MTQSDTKELDTDAAAAASGRGDLGDAMQDFQ